MVIIHRISGCEPELSRALCTQLATKAQRWIPTSGSASREDADLAHEGVSVGLR
jgi:hypothetical protein